jgi:uncharacterized membrane protein YjgN (DUF898 family)
MRNIVPAIDGRREPVQRFAFYATTRDYFPLFIKNVLLTILTLGIYSAWAKVNARRFFYGNTEIDGHAFDYIANPKTILKGRIIAFAVFAAYNVAAELSPYIAIGLLPVIAFAWPVIVNNGLRFDARMTTYRNVRFDFEGTYWRSFWIFTVLPVLAIVSVGILAPVATRAAARYRAAGTRFGTLPFEAEPPLGALYQALWVAAAPVILCVIGLLAVMFLSGTTIFGPLVASLAPLLFIAVFAFGAMLYGVAARNVTVNSLVLDGRHRFRSNLAMVRVFDLTATNLLAVVVSLGLLLPWARIRMRRYLTEQTGVVSDGPLGDVIDDMGRRGSVTAAEGLDLDGFGGIEGFGA